MIGGQSNKVVYQERFFGHLCHKDFRKQTFYQQLINLLTRLPRSASFCNSLGQLLTDAFSVICYDICFNAVQREYDTSLTLSQHSLEPQLPDTHDADGDLDRGVLADVSHPPDFPGQGAGSDMPGHR